MGPFALAFSFGHYEDSNITHPSATLSRTHMLAICWDISSWAPNGILKSNSFCEVMEEKPLLPLGRTFPSPTTKRTSASQDPSPPIFTFSFYGTVNLGNPPFPSWERCQDTPLRQWGGSPMFFFQDLRVELGDLWAIFGLTRTRASRTRGSLFFIDQ